MKPLLAIAAAVLATTSLTHAADSSSAPAAGRVGLYDSRVVAYAHFWSQPERARRDALAAEGKAAKAAGQQARFDEIARMMTEAQFRSHLQVFSVAPADEALAALEFRLPEIRRELGVERLVSRWDEAALKAVPTSARVDVTDQLVREFAPDQERQAIVEQIKRSKPLPLAEAQRKLAPGKGH